MKIVSMLEPFWKKYRKTLTLVPPRVIYNTSLPILTRGVSKKTRGGGVGKVVGIFFLKYPSKLKKNPKSGVGFDPKTPR